jgi:hypothetical protein
MSGIDKLRLSGTNIAKRGTLNLIGSGVDITAVDDEDNDEIEVTLTSTDLGSTTRLSYIAGEYDFAVHTGALDTYDLTDLFCV